MIVTLQKDNQFGEDGPQTGAKGIITDVRMTSEDGGDDYWATVVWIEFRHLGFCHVPLKYLMTPDTSGTHTVWRSR